MFCILLFYTKLFYVVIITPHRNIRQTKRVTVICSENTTKTNDSAYKYLFNAITTYIQNGNYKMRARSTAYPLFTTGYWSKPIIQTN